MGWYHFDKFDVELVIEREWIDIPCSREHLLSGQNLIVSFHHFLLDCIDTHVKIIFRSVRVCKLEPQVHYGLGNR